jgi:HNH endonuclease
MAIGPRLRFEVFKRDRFTCAYCGRTAADVLLHVDHVIPVVAGGTDDLANLVTACVDCNLGKGPRLLEEGDAPAIGEAAITNARQRALQLREYREWQEQIEAETGRLLDMVWDYWTTTFGGQKTDDGWECEVTFPAQGSVRRFLGELTIEDIFHAIDIARWRVDKPSPERGQLAPWEVSRYFYGVCHGKVRDRREQAEAERAAATRRAVQTQRVRLVFSPGPPGMESVGQIIKRMRWVPEGAMPRPEERAV